MDYMNQNIAINLKTIRQAKGYSLDVVSEQTGVSKSMLGQIERGEANPTIGILGKIVSGLRVELSDLIKTPKDRVYTVPKDNLIPTKEAAGKYVVYTYFPYEKGRNFELYTIEIQPGMVYESGPHGENTTEYIFVEQGELTVSIDEKEHPIKAGDAIRFATDKNHIYINKGDELLHFVCVFYYTAR